MLWDEYVRDNSSKYDHEGKQIKDIIPSKNFMKERILK
jgi:hypothetical protein